MKKFLLPGMLATLAFAACTNEEIVSQQTEAPEVDLSNRPVVGMVDLNFGPQTRLAQGDDAFNQVVWEENDKIGARIIDQPNPAVNYYDHSMNYTAQNDFASSNYEYKRGSGASWSTEALLVEGHYMFYAPYNKAQGRTPLVMEFPYEQKINKIVKDEVNEEAVGNFFKNTKNQTVLVGHAFVAADGKTSVTPFMEHLYAYPQITLKNAKKFYATNGEDTIAKELKLKKIIIEDAEAQIKNKYQIHHGNLMAEMRNAVDKRLNGKNEYYTEVKKAMPAGDWQSPLKLLRDGKSSDIWTVPADAQKKSIVIDVENVYTMANGEAIQFHAVMPALEYEEGKLTVNVVFEGNDGILWKFVNPVTFDAVTTAHETMTLAPGKRYPREEYDFSTSYEKGYATKSTAGLLATFQLTSGEAVKYEPQSDPVYIRYARELGEWLNEKVKNNTATLQVGIDPEDTENDIILQVYKGLTGNSAWMNGLPELAFTDSVINVVNEYLDEGKLKFEDQMIVTGADLKPDKARFEFLGGVYQTEGTLALSACSLGASTFNGEVTLTNINAVGNDMVFNNNATVNGGEYGTLTFNNAKTVKFENTVEATAVTLANGASAIDSLDTDILNINGGKVVVPANFAGDLGTINVMNATLETKKAITNNIVLGVKDTGTPTKTYYNNGATLDVQAADFNLANVTLNAGEIKLNANTTMPASFISKWNTGNITNALGKKLTVSGGVEIPKVATCDNVPAATLKFINKGTVSGELSVATGAVVENDYELQVKNNKGTITTGTDSRTYVTGTEEGVINNSSLSFVQTAGKQTVYAEFEDSYASLTVDALENKGPGLRYINKLIFKNGLTIDKPFSSDLLDNVTALEFKGGDVVVKTFASTSVKDVTISDNVVFRGTLDRENTGFGFKDGANIKIATGKTMTVAYMTMATMSPANGLIIEGNVIVKDANLYLGIGAAPNYGIELNGKIENAYVDANKQKTTQHTDALKAALSRKDPVIELHNAVTLGDYMINVDHDLTLNLNGNNLSSTNATATIQLNAGKTMTINGANATVSNNTAGAEVILNLGGNLTINDGTYDAQGTGNSAAVVCNRLSSAGTWNLTINSGTFKSKEFTAVSLQNNRGKEGGPATSGLATINGGTFTGGSTYYDLYLANVNATIDTEECTFTNKKVYVHTSDEHNNEINGNLVTSTVFPAGVLPLNGSNEIDWTKLVPATPAH